MGNLECLSGHPGGHLNLVIYRSHLKDITDHQVPDLYLRRLPAPDDAEDLLALDAVLEAAELLLLRPVVEGRHQHDDDDRDEDSRALDPRRVLILLDCNGIHKFVIEQKGLYTQYGL